MNMFEPPFFTIRLIGDARFHHCEVGWHWAPPPLPDHDFWFVAEGRGEAALGGLKIALQPGVCFVWRPGDMPLISQDPGHRLTVFYGHFEPLDAAGNLAPPLELPQPLRVRDIGFFVASAHRAESLLRRGDFAARVQSRRILENLLLQLWDESRVAAPSPLDAPFLELAAAIGRQPGARWKLDDMAAQVHLSRAQFVRRFGAIVGAAPGQFVLRTRLERARQLLSETDMTQEQIARALGFTDAAFFSRQFRAVFGHPPGQLRKN